MVFKDLPRGFLELPLGLLDFGSHSVHIRTSPGASWNSLWGSWTSRFTFGSHSVHIRFTFGSHSVHIRFTFGLPRGLLELPLGLLDLPAMSNAPPDVTFDVQQMSMIHFVNPHPESRTLVHLHYLRSSQSRINVMMCDSELMNRTVATTLHPHEIMTLDLRGLGADIGNTLASVFKWDVLKALATPALQGSFEDVFFARVEDQENVLPPLMPPDSTTTLAIPASELLHLALSLRDALVQVDDVLRMLVARNAFTRTSNAVIRDTHLLDIHDNVLQSLIHMGALEGSRNEFAEMSFRVKPGFIR